MLPRALRLNASADFRRTIKGGVRVGRPTLVLHAGPALDHSGVRVGLVVSKAVGNAVTRNRVKRQIRHLAAASLMVPEPSATASREPASSAPPVIGGPGIDVVVRALPRAAQQPAELPTDLASAWRKARSRLATPR